ncbi:hypothetical protein [Gynuella sp.]|uniref:hypothetical protein n=1 Tax=Gynuella sp. TaxID=2969146 RepID=UPI003D0AFC05
MIKEKFKVYELVSNEGLTNEAASSLHQVAEQLHSMILLVFTRYKFKVHDLEKLRTLTGSIEPEFLSAFPESSPFECSCFELLRQAYVDSRHAPGYAITVEQLNWLAGRIRHF